MQARERLSEFIGSERERFHHEHNNRFAFSFSKIITYYEFLEIIIGRFEPLSRNYTSILFEYQRLVQATPTQGRSLTAHERTMIDELGRLQKHLHLEIETFYQFAKILLDKTALSFEVYFGAPRGRSYVSFSKFTKAFEEIGTEFGLTDAFKTTCTKLELEVSNYRDKKVVHEYRAELIHTVTITNGTSISLTPACIRARSLQDFEGSKDPRELLSLIDAYLLEYLGTIQRNHPRTRLRLRPTEPG